MDAGTWVSELEFRVDGYLLPVVIQDAAGGEVLMLGYMNREALERTLDTGKVWFYSRSRGRLWLKGETSGHYQEVVEILPDCDNDALLIRVRQVGGACHTGYFSCFYRRVYPKFEEPVTRKVFEPEEVYGREAPGR